MPPSQRGSQPAAVAMKVVEFGAVASLTALTLFSFVAVLLRWIVGRPLPDAFDFTGLLLAPAVLWGIAMSLWRDDQIRADLIWPRLTRPLKAAVDVLGRVLVLVAIGCLAWKMNDRVWDVFRSGQGTSQLGVGIWPFLAVALAGCVAAGIGSALWLSRALAGRMDADDKLQPGPQQTDA